MSGFRGLSELTFRRFLKLILKTGKLHYGLQVQKQEFRVFNGNVNNNYGMLFVTCQSMDAIFPVGKKITKLGTVVQNENSYFLQGYFHTQDPQSSEFTTDFYLLLLFCIKVTL